MTQSRKISYSVPFPEEKEVVRPMSWFTENGNPTQRFLDRSLSVYVASAWDNKPEARRVRSRLEAIGFTVTASWIDQDGAYGEPEGLKLEAVRDIAEIRAVDVVVVVSPSGEDTSRGGHHSELGMALAFRKPVVLVGPRRNVFHYTPGIRYFASVAEFLDADREEVLTHES